MVQAVEKQATPVRGAKLWPMSVEAYHVLGEAGVISDNTELLYGLVYNKMPKSPLHSFLLRALLKILQGLNLPGLLVSAEQPLTIGDSEPEPDIAIISGANEDFSKTHPTTAELVIEICVTSHEYDRSKLRAYATANVKECWLVLGREKQIEIFSDPKDGGYRKSITHTGGLLTSQAIPQLTIDPSSLFKTASAG